MTTDTTRPTELELILTRLSAIELSIAEIRAQINRPRSEGDWLDHVIGSISDDDAFSKVLEYGREFRKSAIQD